MKKINNQWYTDKQYIEILEKKIKELEETNKLMLINDDELLKTNAINRLKTNKLQQRIDKTTDITEDLYKMVKEQDSDNVNLIDRIEIILKSLKGEENESN